MIGLKFVRKYEHYLDYISESWRHQTVSYTKLQQFHPPYWTQKCSVKASWQKSEIITDNKFWSSLWESHDWITKCAYSQPHVIFRQEVSKGKQGNIIISHIFFKGTEGYLCLQAMCINDTRELHIFAVGCSDHIELPVLSDIKKFRQMYSCHVTQRNLQSSLSQLFWKANHVNYVPHNQQITLTTGCVHNTRDPRLVASISALYATHTPCETDINLILDSLLCVQHLYSK